MTYSHAGLILDAVGALLLAFESWVKTRGIKADRIAVGHGEIGIVWRVLFPLGWPLLVAGFVLQYIGTK